MRNVLVVLVPLCFGLASGFIVPSGIQEIISELKGNANSIHSSARKTRNILPATENLATSSTSDIPSSEKAVNGSLDTDLYEHSHAKESDVKARAYIYIKQNGNKELIRNRLYDSPVKKPQHSNNHKSYLDKYDYDMNKVFEELPRQFWIGYMSRNLQTNTESEKLDHRCHAMKNKHNQKKPNENLRTGPYKTYSNEQLKFLELLKAPLLRAEFKSSDRLNLDKNKFKYLNVDRQKGNTSYVFNSSEFGVKTDTLENIENLKGKMGKEHKKIGQKNNITSLLSGKSLLDELIKQNLNEHGSLFGCRDCLNKAKKNELSNRLHLETECKCACNLLPRGTEKSKQ